MVAGLVADNPRAGGPVSDAPSGKGHLPPAYLIPATREK